MPGPVGNRCRSGAWRLWVCRSPLRGPTLAHPRGGRGTAAVSGRHGAALCGPGAGCRRGLPPLGWCGHLTVIGSAGPGDVVYALRGGLYGRYRCVRRPFCPCVRRRSLVGLGVKLEFWPPSRRSETTAPWVGPRVWAFRRRLPRLLLCAASCGLPVAAGHLLPVSWSAGSRRCRVI